MREIKFRAWVSDAGGYDDDIYQVIPGMVYDPVFWFPYESGDVSCSDYFNQTDVIAWMQYIGLQDKNCKEIYEGDVVEDHIGVGVVEYSDKRAAFRVNYRDGMAKWFLDYNIKGEIESIEVIGNIYENPELMNN